MRMLLLILATPSLARADGREAPVADAFEIGVGVDHARMRGALGDSLGRAEVLVPPTEALEISFDYRLGPALGLGMYATVSSRDGIDGASGGFFVRYHDRPDRTLDPWISVGSGWKMLWLGDASHDRLNGLELARVRVGVDVRLGRGLSIAPTIGIGVSTFFTRGTGVDPMDIRDRGIQVTTCAGLVGRFAL